MTKERGKNPVENIKGRVTPPPPKIIPNSGRLTSPPPKPSTPKKDGK